MFQLGPNGVDGLEDDYVMNNMLDMLAIEEMILDCTSCKTEDADCKAVARCANCAQFLCTNCVSAHKFMRCFENHRVVRFDEIKSSYNRNLRKMHGEQVNDDENMNVKLNNDDNRLFERGVPIHKPLFCKLHPKEGLKFFCNSCQVNNFAIVQ